MKRVRLSATAAFLSLAWCVPFAAAQTQNISNLSGNGQLICPQCPLNNVQQFDPMSVKVTDSNGNPVTNAEVDWTLVAGQGTLGAPFTFGSGSTYSSFTDGTGVASASYFNNTFNFGNSNQPYLQAQIQANTVTGSIATFYETITAPPATTSAVQANQLVQVLFLTANTTPSCAACADPNDVANVIAGVSGSTAPQQIGVAVDSPGTSLPTVPNVAVHLIPNQNSPTASCATGAGADPGTVLTDQNGLAFCKIILNGAGTGTFVAAVGGVTPNVSNLVGYQQSGNFNIKVTAGIPSSVNVVSGSAQTANPGQTFPLPLIAIVRDQNGNPTPGQNVTWTVSPAGAATLTGTVSTSDANGQVRTNVTLAPNSAGTITVRAVLNANTNLAAVFTESANVQVTGLNIVSGNNQTAIVNTSFASPLIVQLTTSNGVATSGVPVQFILTGPGTLSSSTVTTGANGQAQTTVFAAGTTGTITVSALAGNFNTVFTLTVIPAGPSLTVSSFYNGADFQRGSLSPCSIATIIAPGIAPTLQGTVTSGMLGPLPYLMAGDSVTINGAQAPIYNVSNVSNQQQITIQIPCSVTPGQANVTVNVSGGTASIIVPINPASPGIFGTATNGTLLPVLVRPDGSFVSAQNPARRGETLIAFATGLGATTPSVTTNSLPIPGSTTNPQGTVIVGFAGGGIPFISAVMSPDLIGVFEVAFQVPGNAPTGNVSFSLGILPQGSNTVYNSALGTFPVQ